MTQITEQSWGGAGVSLYTLTNAQGAQVQITNYGGRLVSWRVPDQHQQLQEILLGYSDLRGYQNDTAFLGAQIGRWANRIEGAQFQLNGQSYVLEANENNNSLHSGSSGFHREIWQGKIHDQQLELSLTQADGTGGFPGELTVKIRHELRDDGLLLMHYEAQCSADTPLNLTSHAYFNLSGSDDIRQHVAQIAAHEFMAIDDELIPYGIEPLTHSPLDLQQPTRLSQAIHPVAIEEDEQLFIAQGYDHCYRLDPHPFDQPVATVYCEQSGLSLQLFTTAAGVQFYTGNFLAGVVGRKPYQAYDGFCLEPGAYPNQINSPERQGAIAKAGEVWHQTIGYQVCVRDC